MNDNIILTKDNIILPLDNIIIMPYMNKITIIPARRFFESTLFIKGGGNIFKKNFVSVNSDFATNKNFLFVKFKTKQIFKIIFLFCFKILILLLCLFAHNQVF